MGVRDFAGAVDWVPESVHFNRGGTFEMERDKQSERREKMCQRCMKEFGGNQPNEVQMLNKMSQ